MLRYYVKLTQLRSSHSACRGKSTLETLAIATNKIAFVCNLCR